MISSSFVSCSNDKFDREFGKHFVNQKITDDDFT